jgi:uncharacterized membrane protein YbhN (UPF0104 family)
VPLAAARAAVRRVTRRRWLAGAALAVLLLTEAALGGRELVAALGRLTEPDWRWVIAAVVAELGSMGAYARMQRRLLRGEGVTVTLPAAVRLAYAAHALSISLPGGPVFSTAYNFRRMRDLGASPAVASSCIALGGVLSGAALVVVAALAELLRGGHEGLVATSVRLGLALAVAVGVRALVRRPARLVALAGTALAGVNRLRRRPAGSGLARVRAGVADLTTVRMGRVDLVDAAGLALLNWVLDGMALVLCIRAVGAELPALVPLVLAYAAGMTAASLTVVPGGLGVVDGALVVGLLAAGAAAAPAIAAVVLYRLLSLGLVGGLGWLLFLVDRRRGVDTAAA